MGIPKKRLKKVVEFCKKVWILTNISESFASAFTYPLGRRGSEYSGGQQQFVALAKKAIVSETGVNYS